MRGRHVKGPNQVTGCSQTENCRDQGYARQELLVYKYEDGDKDDDAVQMLRNRANLSSQSPIIVRSDVNYQK